MPRSSGNLLPQQRAGSRGKKQEGKEKHIFSKRFLRRNKVNCILLILSERVNKRCIAISVRIYNNKGEICCGAVPLHPKPMTAAGRILAQMEGNPTKLFPTHIKAIIRVSFSMERAWIPPWNSRNGGGSRWLFRRGETTRLVLPRSGG